jgi:hypothetical protein
MASAWRLFEFDVTAAAKPGGTNSPAIEVFPSLPHDLAITWHEHSQSRCFPLARRALWRGQFARGWNVRH